MELIKADWYGEIKGRRSRRTFQERKINDTLFKKLGAQIKEFNGAIDGARAVLVREGCEEILTGSVGPYGIISGAQTYVAFIADQKDPAYQAKTGYLGQAIILEATNNDLASCWVSGFFNPELTAKSLNLSNDERVLAISPLGYAASKFTIKEKLITKVSSGTKRKNINQICLEGFKSHWPNWIRTAIKAARWAPSAKNRQPWRFSVEDSLKVKISIDESGTEIDESKKLDCGIAMLNFEVGALFAGAKGSWEYSTGKEVAEFELDKII